MHHITLATIVLCVCTVFIDNFDSDWFHHFTESCPYGKSWTGKAYLNASTTDLIPNPHVYRECSNQGLCDRKTGLCECFEGFEGHVCQRSTCQCEHGNCLTIGEFYSLKNRFYLPSSYSGWESSQVTACICDYGSSRLHYQSLLTCIAQDTRVPHATFVRFKCS